MLFVHAGEMASGLPLPAEGPPAKRTTWKFSINKGRVHLSYLGMCLVDIIQIEGYKNSSQVVNRYPFHAKTMRWQLKIVGQV